LFEERGIEPPLERQRNGEFKKQWRHDKLIKRAKKEISNPKLSKGRVGRIFHKARKLRNIGDYSDIGLEKPNIVEIKSKAEELFEVITDELKP